MRGIDTMLQMGGQDLLIDPRDPMLHKTSRPVTNFDDRLHDLLDDLKETLANAGGAGTLL